MIVVSKSFSAASVSLKIGTLILFICLIIHVVGFTVARWASVTISVANNGTGIQTFYHAGLWLHCGCVDLGEISCICYSRGGDPGWFNAVQAMETIGLIGLSVTALMCLGLVFYKQTMVLKKVNIAIILSSVIFIVVGLIIFGIENMEDTQGMFEMFDKNDNENTHGSLRISFILCALSVSVCFFVCLPLLVIDLRTPLLQHSTLRNYIAQAPVQYSNQGQVIIPSSGQAQVIISLIGQQNLGFVPAFTYGQCVALPQYAASGQDINSHPEQTNGIPHQE
ncbi:uncharacterized protein LOC132754394 isoform X2 [Ruditapes philippinarum]|uniref:uncharacterized protein LOC132754394 isoform X2 n=1 Tax=Ruditapes philippinarum TaxID=129788 RepID=UPI00295A626F|nr:uncharacterized protein LOC132754394 isoform X2 [Ruditapes philippinarum]